MFHRLYILIILSSILTMGSFCQIVPSINMDILDNIISRQIDDSSERCFIRVDSMGLEDNMAYQEWLNCMQDYFLLEVRFSDYLNNRNSRQHYILLLDQLIMLDITFPTNYLDHLEDLE